ncbi:unnamed protein product [Cochlearia groenlandica]
MERNNPPRAHIMMVSIIIMLNTLRPILMPPDFLNNESNTKTYVDEFLVIKQLATTCFWVFVNLAFGFTFTAALALALSRDGSPRDHRDSFKLAMIAMLFMSLSSKCLLVLWPSPSLLLSAYSIVETMLIMTTLFAFSDVLLADII